MKFMFGRRKEILLAAAFFMMVFFSIPVQAAEGQEQTVFDLSLIHI